MDDSGIINLFFLRDQAAICAVQERYGSLVRRIAAKLLPKAEDAEECESDTYWGLWNAIPPERPDPLAAFIARIARNTALNRRRRDGAEKRQGDSFALSMEELSDILPSEPLEEHVSARELGQAIDRFLSEEEKDNRKLFVRRYWFGESVKELAEETEMGENAVSARLSRMRKRLKAYLEEEGFCV